MGIYILFFLFTMLDSARLKILVLLALACFGTAVFIDFVEGMELRTLNSYQVSHFMKSVEEMLELLGQTLFLITFLSVLLPHKGKVIFEFGDGDLLDT